MSAPAVARPNVAEAVRLLGAATAGRFDPWMLAGNSRGAVRAQVMSLLLGLKTPVSRSGVYALQEALFAALEVPAGASCHAERDDWLAARARALVGAVAP